MKTLRKMIASALLMCVLAVSVSAGEMQAGITNPPPPPPMGEVADGEIECGITESVLMILESVLSAF